MALLLMVFWLVLNGRLDGDVWITGAVLVALTMAFAIAFGGWSPKKEWTALTIFPGMCSYVGALFVEIVKANVCVIRLIFTKQTSPCVRTIQTSLKTTFARVALANSITLTPGTVTVQLVDDHLTVHCLTREMAEGLENSALEKRLLEMEAKIRAKRV